MDINKQRGSRMHSQMTIDCTCGKEHEVEFSIDYSPKEYEGLHKFAEEEINPQFDSEDFNCECGARIELSKFENQLEKEAEDLVESMVEDGDLKRSVTYPHFH